MQEALRVEVAALHPLEVLDVQRDQGRESARLELADDDAVRRREAVVLRPHVLGDPPLAVHVGDVARLRALRVQPAQQVPEVLHLVADHRPAHGEPVRGLELAQPVGAAAAAGEQMRLVRDGEVRADVLEAPPCEQLRRHEIPARLAPLKGVHGVLPACRAVDLPDARRRILAHDRLAPDLLVRALRGDDQARAHVERQADLGGRQRLARARLGDDEPDAVVLERRGDVRLLERVRVQRQHGVGHRTRRTFASGT